MKKRFGIIGAMTLALLIGIGILLSGSSLREVFGSKGEESSFIVVSDVHTSNDKSKMEKMAELVSDINEGIYKHVDFLVITGDCVSSFLENRDQDYEDPDNNRVLKLMNVLKDLEKSFYLVMGNHEYKIDRGKDSDDSYSRAEIDTIEAMWKRYTGFDPYYSFRHGDMKYVVLNSMRGRPEERPLDDDQVSWFRQELLSADPMILFFHHPVKTDHPRIWALKKDMISENVEPEFMDLCEENAGKIRGIFVGHGHRWVKDHLYKEIPVFETGSFGDKPEVIGYMVSLDAENHRISKVEKIIHK